MIPIPTYAPGDLGGGFTPDKLFSGGEVGVWYDPSDIDVNWRRNWLLYSEQIDNAAWAKSNVSVTPNAIAAPDGTSTADLVVPVATNTDHYILQTSIATSAIQLYTLSAYVKSSGYDFIIIGSGGGGAFGSVVYQFSTNTFSNISGAGVASYSSQVLSNGWVRINIVGIPLTTSGIGLILTPRPTSANNRTFLGDGVSGAYIWGCQINVGSTPLDYQRITDSFLDYYQIRSLPLMYQSSTGINPVSGLEQPVGLLLDKSKGLQLSSQLLVNGDFDSAATWAGATSLISSGAVRFVAAINNSGIFKSQTEFAVGKTFQFTVEVSSISSGAISVTIGIGSPTSSNCYNITTPGTHTFTQGPGNDNFIRIYSIGTSTTAVVERVIVKEIPGNHAFQGTAAARPVLSARVNLLTYTQEFDNAVWIKFNSTVTANTTTASDGSLTADTLLENTSNSSHNLYRSQTVVTNVRHRVSIQCKAVSSDRYLAMPIAISQTDWVCVKFDPTTQTLSSIFTSAITTITNTSASFRQENNGFFTVTLDFSSPTSSIFVQYAATNTMTAPNSVSGLDAYTGEVTKGIILWGASLVLTNQASLPYQRVRNPTAGTSTTAGVPDYDATNFPIYLRFDGVDDILTQNTTNDLNFGQGSFWAQIAIGNSGNSEFDVIWGKSNSALANNIRLFINASNLMQVFWGSDTQSYLPVSNTETFRVKKTIPQLLEWGIDSSSAQAFYANNNNEDRRNITLSGTGSNTVNSNLGADTQPLYPSLMNMYQCIIRKGSIPSSALLLQTRVYVNQKTKAY